MKRWLFYSSVAVAMFCGGFVQAEETGSILGLLVDANNQKKFVGRAAVFVCDPETGYPLVAKSKKPLALNGQAQELKDLWHVVTETDGSFKIADVAPGKYRLVAQSWSGVEGIPERRYTSEFIRNVGGVTHMSLPHVTFVGLPEERDVHLALFNYDNSPGVGGATFRAGESSAVQIKIYAGWSNGHDEPPKRLKPLVEYLERRDPPLFEVMDLGRRDDFVTEGDRLDHQKVWKAMLENAEKVVTVEGVGPVRVIDIGAADAYKRLRAHHAAIRNRKRK